MNRKIKSVLKIHSFFLCFAIICYIIFLIGSAFIAFIEWRPWTEVVGFSIPTFDETEKRGLFLAFALITFFGLIMDFSDD